MIDEPPVMWSPPGSGFEASPLSPAGEMQGFWRLTGRGSDAHEKEASRLERGRRIGRVGSFVLKMLGSGRRQGAPGDGRSATGD
jgi:hypothetical protein